MAKRSRMRLTPAGSTAATTPVTPRRPGMRRSVGRRGYQRTFLERYGTWLLGGVVVVGVLLIGFVALSSASQPAYACEAQLTPGPSEPNPTPRPSASPSASASASASSSALPSSSAGASASASVLPSQSVPASVSPSPSAAASPTPVPTPAPQPTARLGFTTIDLGRNHVTGTVKYSFCPPTSGDHYNIAGQSPMQPAVYGASQNRSPQYWIHNLEHGYVVLAYRCPSGVLGQGDCISTAEMAQVQSWFDDTPPPTKTKCPKKVIAVRFDGMDTRFALIAWDRVLLSDQFDLQTANTFTQQWEDAFTTPEEGSC